MSSISVHNTWCLEIWTWLSSFVYSFVCSRISCSATWTWCRLMSQLCYCLAIQTSLHELIHWIVWDQDKNILPVTLLCCFVVISWPHTVRITHMVYLTSLMAWSLLDMSCFLKVRPAWVKFMPTHFLSTHKTAQFLATWFFLLMWLMISVAIHNVYSSSAALNFLFIHTSSSWSVNVSPSDMTTYPYFLFRGLLSLIMLCSQDVV